jgi:hypothetical protein
MLWIPIALLLLASPKGPATQREVVPPPDPSATIRGVVVFEEDESPVVGHPVRLFGPKIEPLSATTDANGRFTFPRPAIEEGQLRVSAPHTPGLRLVQTQLRDPGDGSELRFVARRVVERPFAGLATRQSTGEPLRDVLLCVSERHGPSDTCRTDEHGAFETTELFAGPKLLVAYLEDDTSASRSTGRSTSVAWDSADPDALAIVPLKVGPRLELDFVPSLNTDWGDYRVEVVPPGEGLGVSFRGQVAPLHAGTPASVRFPTDMQLVSGWELRVIHEGDSRTWFARIPARPTAPLRPELVSTGSLAIRFTSAGKEPSVTPSQSPDNSLVGMTLQLLDGPGTMGTSLEFEARLHDARPRPGIEAGRWLVRTHSAFFASTEAKVSVPPGGEVALTLELGLPKPTGVVRIRLVDELGDVPEFGNSFGTPDYTAGLSGGGLRWGYSVVVSAWCGTGIDAYFRRRQVDGRWVLEAELPGIPFGTYTASAESSSRLIEPVSQDARPGATACFVIRAPRDRDVYGFHVTTKGGGKAGTYWVFSLSEDKPLPFRGSPIVGGVHAYELPERGDLAWYLWDFDHQRVYGDRSSFVGRDGGHWVDVVLEPGFRVRLVAARPDGSPAAGVAVEFAGERFVTDERGRATLATLLKRPPLLLEFPEESVGGGELAADGSFDEYDPELRVVVEKR